MDREISREIQAELDEMFRLEASEPDPYEVELEGETYTLWPKVFSPKYRGSSVYYNQVVPQHARGRCLDLGTGAGILAVRLAKRGLKVIATDINPRTIANCLYNANNCRVNKKPGLEVREGDLFYPIWKDKFDTICWHHPWVKTVEVPQNITLQVTYDYRYNTLQDFFAQAKYYLRPGGQILLGSGSLADQGQILQLSERYRYQSEILDQDRISLMIGGDVMVEAFLYRFWIPS